jgi:hypothetical protein
MRNLTAKTLTYFGRNEVTHLRLMSEHLLSMAQEVGTHTATDTYRWRSVSFLLEKQTAVPISTYQDALKETLQEEVRLAQLARPESGAGGSAQTNVLDGMTLTLIDASEMDQLLSLDQVARRFNSHYETVLQTLNERLGTLLFGDVIPLSGNPFRPEVLVRALMLGWKRSDFDEQVCSDLLRSLSPQHSLDLKPLYEDMNAALAQAGISSVTPTHRIRKAADVESGSALPSERGALGSTQPSSGYGAFSSSARHPSHSGHGDFAHSGGSAAYGGAPDSSASGANFENSRAATMPPEFGGAVRAPGASGHGRLAPLGQTIAAHARQFLQRLGFSHATGIAEGDSAPAIIGVPADPGLMGYLGGLQANGGAEFIHDRGDALDPMGHNVLRRMREQEQVKQAPEIDRGTVDALAEVFDYVFADPSIPAHLKLVIARLQIPTLKAAMIDREFFLSESHPARRLIDALAQGSVTWNVEKGEQDPLYLQIEKTVRRALDEFEDDLALFEDLLLEFAEFQQQAEQQAQTHIAPVTKAEQSDESLALARAHADEVVQARISALPQETPLAPLLLPFLTIQWREVLARAWLKVQTQRELWNGALATMDQLIWSTQPQTVAVERRQRDPVLTPYPQERRQLMRVLPDLIRNLDSGLDSIRWSGKAREDFMSGLMELHMHAVRTAPPTPEELQRRAAEAQAGEEALRALDERVAQTQSVPKDEFALQALAMERGMWFDYLNEHSQLHRCRLSWISPKRTRLLFTNREGFDAFVRSEQEVVELLREGRITVIDQAPIVGRALGQLMSMDALT